MQKNPFTIYCLQKLKEQGRRFLLIWYNNPMIFRSYFCKLGLIPAHDPQFLVQKLNISNDLFRKSISTPVCRIHSIFQYICPISYEHEKTAPHLNPLSYIHIFSYRFSSRTTQSFLMWEIQTEIFITIHLARNMKVETLINIYFSLVFRQIPMHAFYKIKKRAICLGTDPMLAMTRDITHFYRFFWQTEPITHHIVFYLAVRMWKCFTKFRQRLGRFIRQSSVTLQQSFFALC